MLRHTKYNICSSFNDFNICKMDRTLQTNIFKKKLENHLIVHIEQFLTDHFDR